MRQNLIIRKALKEIVRYSNKRVSLLDLTLDNYVATDNLLQNKQGKIRAESLPPYEGNVTSFEENDILISNIRPYLKKLWFATYSGGSSADVLVLKVNDTFDAKYIYYSIFQDSFFEHMMNGSKGTKMPRGDKKQILDFQVLPNTIEIQTSIAKVLSDLDSKIELNNKINQQLEEMAKTIYDYWFVQFDFPNNEGKPYKSSGGKMVYNKELKREIPEGWKVKGLFKSCLVQYGFPFSTDFFNEDGNGVPVIRIRDILNNTISNYSTEEGVDNKYIIEKGNILVGMDGNFHINYWTKDNCFLNQRVVRITSTIFPNIYIKYQIEPYIKLRERSVSRTTVGHLSDKDLKAIKIIVPSSDILSSISTLFNDILNKIIHIHNENQSLSSLRDWLLPMLMNGQITVKEAEDAINNIAAEPEIKGW